MTKGRTIRPSTQTLSPSDLPSSDLPIETLRQLWRDQFGTEPGRSFSRSFLAKAVGWKMQVAVHGDISLKTRREMQRLVAHARAARKQKDSGRGTPVEVPMPAATQAQPGAQLIKVWRGETYVVHVTSGGFCWEGSTYRSLSAVAKAITGTHWNGLIFFGLRERAEVERRRLARGATAHASPNSPGPKKAKHATRSPRSNASG